MIMVSTEDIRKSIKKPQIFLNTVGCYGTRVSGHTNQFFKLFPRAADDYHMLCKQTLDPTTLLGAVQEIKDRQEKCFYANCFVFNDLSFWLAPYSQQYLELCFMQIESKCKEMTIGVLNDNCETWDRVVIPALKEYFVRNDVVIYK